MSTLIETLQSDILGRLLSDSYFSDVYVASITRGDLDSDEMEHLATTNEKSGKSGVFVGVQMPTADGEKPNLPGPLLGVAATVRVMESPAMNRAVGGTGKTAEQIAARVLQLLHHWSPNGARFLIAGTDALKPVDTDDGVVSYDARVETFDGLDDLVSVAPPTAVVAAGTLTLSCPTSGAAIYYTSDGSFPGTDKTLYSAPFAIGAGDHIRAAAYKSGLAGSSITEITA